ncbi:MAG: hypothetical protein HQK93_09610 [Nitrospirae bacterium]|nr:hypothetical protein [Nitrospirota bacterium]
MSNAEECKQRGFFKKDSIIKICALGCLLQKYEEQGKKIPEMYSYYRDGLFRDGYMSGDKNGMSSLRNMIEEKIIKTKGENFLRNEKKFVGYAYKKKIHNFQNEINLETQNLSDCDKTIEELNGVINEDLKVLGLSPIITSMISDLIPAFAASSRILFVTL